jgi:hypothetical protein
MANGDKWGGPLNPIQISLSGVKWWIRSDDFSHVPTGVVGSTDMWFIPHLLGSVMVM